MSSGEKESSPVTVRILEKEYLISCPHNERAALLDSAELLNSNMREIRDAGKVVGLDRIAVIAALNLANELLKLRSTDQSDVAAIGQRVRNIQDRIETALNHNSSTRG
ncbi:MAG: cell division protein ZapA [Gammaproteobacteria bacterium]|nr:cell division protein ZapA [Gammaproteobacteria bacterium]